MKILPVILFIASIALIFCATGTWHTVGIIAACVLFGFYVVIPVSLILIMAVVHVFL